MLRKIMAGLAPVVLAGALGAFGGQARAVPVQWNFDIFFEDASAMTGGFRFDAASSSFSNISASYASPAAGVFTAFDGVDFTVRDPVSNDFALFLFPAGTDLAGDLTGAPNFEITVDLSFSDPASVLVFSALATCLDAGCVSVGAPEIMQSLAQASSL